MQPMPNVSKKYGSLYRKLSIALVLVVVLVSSVVTLFNYLYLSHQRATRNEHRATEYSANLQESLEWPLWNLDDELIINIGRTFASNAEIDQLIIRDEQGGVVFSQEKPHDQLFKHEVRIKHEGKNIGTVEFSLDMRFYEQQARQLFWSSIATVTALILALLIATGLILSRLVRESMNALVQVTRTIVEGNYGQVVLPVSYEEFSPILSGLKTLSDAVANRESSLKQSNQLLSNEVEERRRAEAGLRQSEERLQLATAAGNIGIWDWDVVNNILIWDQSMYTLYGIQREQFTGAFDAWSRMLHAEDRQYTEGEIQAALRGEREYAPEFRIVRPYDGKVRIIKALSKTYFNAEGVASRMVGSNIDITDRKQAEQELRRYKDHLEEEVEQRTAELVLARNAAETANLAKSTFLASMSHELRTPLNAILGFSSLMRRDQQLQEAQRKNLDIINRSGEHLLALINDVLEMAKIEAGRVQLEETQFDLGGMVRDVTDMMSLRAHEKGLQLLIDQASHFPRYIVGDEARLRQVLINLIGNAVKFTEVGGVTLRLGTRKNSISHLQIEVEDSGAGIAPADQQRIFEPFVQLGEQAINKGTGLGLTITRQFVELMGGTISLQSTPGKGSLFRVDLPLRAIIEDSIDKPKEPEKRDVVGLLEGQAEYRILIVEDQLDNQLLLANLVKSVGFRVKVAENGKEGVELFQSWHPHLIWMDRRMPVMDGMEATRRIRLLPGGQEVKIVAVTASAFIEQREEMLAAGMDDFIRKPYRFNEIYECMAKNLGVKYRYEDAIESEGQVAMPSPAMLLTLPMELREELCTALESLESDRVDAAIGKVARIDLTLHKMLLHLAANFDYQTMLSALRQV